MTRFASRQWFVFPLVLTMGSILCAPLIASAANKVQTQKIIVPEEKNGQEQSPPTKTEKKSPLDIPLDALPNTQTRQETPSDDETEKSADETRNNTPLPEIMRDLSKLPLPVRQMRELILKTAKLGDIEKLRSLVGTGEQATTLSIGGLDGDPIEYLKGNSGDSTGYEILAILIEVLEAGYVHLDAGKEEELYVWPYFFAWPLEKLTPELKVELFRILTAGDVEDSENSGRYIFYRVGIKPNGQWDFFVAGD